MSVASLIARGNGLFGMSDMSEEQRQTYLPRVARGEWLGAYALSEPNAGSDIANITCRAERVGGGWSITGNKYWCTFADGADYIMLLARSGKQDPARKHAGISAFLIPKKRGTLPEGVKGAPIPKIGYFGWKTWELSFDDCRLPADALIGKEGNGFYLAQSGLEVARAHSAARWRIRSPSSSSACSSARRSASFRPFASRSRTWRPRSRRPDSSCTTSAAPSTRGRDAISRPAW
jgi:acyl-CoA dehydrogenase